MWVRPSLGIFSNSLAFFWRLAAKICREAKSLLVSFSAVIFKAEGITSLVEWDMFTWSLGWTRVSLEGLCKISIARAATTSLTFIWLDVPAPPWKAGRTNCPSSLPDRISSQALAIAFCLARSSSPALKCAAAAAFFISAIA